jgi:hypothetical protein
LCRLWHNEGADHMCHKHIEKPLFDIMVFLNLKLFKNSGL